MIDAIVSSTQATPVLRNAVDQSTTSSAFSAGSDRVQKTGTSSYISPYYEVDTETQSLVYEVRDTSTGKPLLKISSPQAQSSDTVSTYDSNAQIRNASQVLGKASDATVQTSSHSNSDATSNAVQKTEAFATATASAAQAGNSNAGSTTFDQIV